MSEIVLPSAGVSWPAKLTGLPVIYETEAKALCVAFQLALVGSDAPWRGRHTETLVTRDGVAREKVIANLKRIFPTYDGVNPYGMVYTNPEEPDDTQLTEIDIESIAIEIVGEHETIPAKTDPDTGAEIYPERLAFKVQWMNPAGGGVKMPEPADRKSILSRYGSKFRALGGAGKKVAPAVKAKPAPEPPPEDDQIPGAEVETPAEPELPVARPAVAGPKGRPAPAAPARKATAAVARTSTQTEVWNTLLEKLADQTIDNEVEKVVKGKKTKVIEQVSLVESDDNRVGRIFWEVVGAKFPGTDGSLTLTEWGVAHTYLDGLDAEQLMELGVEAE